MPSPPAAEPVSTGQLRLVLSESGEHLDQRLSAATSAAVDCAAVGSVRSPTDSPRDTAATHGDLPGEAETEALLKHLFRHRNTAPFLAYRLIQRLTQSNPSHVGPQMLHVSWVSFSAAELARWSTWGVTSAWS